MPFINGTTYPVQKWTAYRYLLIPLSHILAVDRDHDLAELAACGEALVGGRCLVERERGGDRHAQLAGLEQRQRLTFEQARDERFVLERARAQRRAVDSRALAHQREQVELALRAGADADHRDPPAARERVEVLGHVRRADELEDHVERPSLAEAFWRDHARAELCDVLAMRAVAHG